MNERTRLTQKIATSMYCAYHWHLYHALRSLDLMLYFAGQCSFLFGLIWNSMLFNQRTKDENGRKWKATLLWEGKIKGEREFMQQNVVHTILHVFFFYLTVFYWVSLLFFLFSASLLFYRPIWANNGFEWSLLFICTHSLKYPECVGMCAMLIWFFLSLFKCINLLQFYWNQNEF